MSIPSLSRCRISPTFSSRSSWVKNTRGSCRALPRTDDTIAESREPLHEPLDQGRVVIVDPCQPDLQQVFEGCRPWQEVEEVGGAEHVVSGSPQILANDVPAHVVQRAPPLHRQPVGLVVFEAIRQLRGEPEKAGAVRATLPLEPAGGERIHGRVTHGDRPAADGLRAIQDEHDVVRAADAAHRMEVDRVSVEGVHPTHADQARARVERSFQLLGGRDHALRSEEADRYSTLTECNQGRMLAGKSPSISKISSPFSQGMPFASR